MRATLVARAALVLILGGLAGCQVAPLRPAEPAVKAPAAFGEVQPGVQPTAGTAATEPVAEFWRNFNDPALDALVQRAVAIDTANSDLRVAAARVAEARALVQAADGLGRPTLDVSAGALRGRSADSGAPTTGSRFALGAQSQWEIDLYGRIAGERGSAAATLRATEAQRRAVQVSVAAEVARVYFELRGLQEQLRVTRLDLETQRQALRLVQARLDVGRGTALDTERAKALVESTAAAVPALETALVRNRLRLAVLTGQAPGSDAARAGSLAALADVKPLPALPATPLTAIGSPEGLFKRRPDIAAAEAQLRAFEAQSGVARSRLYPAITLQGSLGLNAGRVADLPDSASFVFNLGAQLLWSVIDHGQRRAQVNAADARRDAALAQFDQVLLAALEETEGALAGFTRAQARSDSLMRAATASTRAAEIARARFEAGTIDFLVLLDAEREALRARDVLAQSQTAAATSLVAVYRALAGGW